MVNLDAGTQSENRLILTESSELLLSALLWTSKGNVNSGEVGGDFKPLTIALSSLESSSVVLGRAFEVGDDRVMMGFSESVKRDCVGSSNSLLTMNLTEVSVSMRESR